ncbi:threonine/serine dehydratase [Novosphingobium sp. 11B]
MSDALGDLASISRAELEAARKVLSPYITRTPLIRLDGVRDRDIWLQPENLQPLGSFKVRCATLAVLSLDHEQRKLGIMTASAGNFGQGLAKIGRSFGVPLRVYAPDTTARSKIDAMRALGADVIEIAFDEWWAILSGALPAAEKHCFIHPSSGRTVILGNATIAAEIIEYQPDIDAILVPFGGGGLALGIATAVRLLRPGIRVIACESDASTPLTAAFQHGRPIEVECDRSGFIDGTGGVTVLPSQWANLRRYLADTSVVT